MNLEATRGNRRALVLYHRSIRWCWFCRSQIVQLQHHLAEFEAAGIAVFAISYDSVDEKRKFADEFGITFPMLADPEHRVIEATGILNTLIRPDEEDYGLPFPGTFVLGTDGRIEEKLFFQHYSSRPSASTVLREGFGIDFEVKNHPQADVTGEGVTISATLGGESMVFGEATMLYVDIDLDEGLHIYGRPVPEGFVATEVSVTGPEGVAVGEPRYPETKPFRIEGIERDFWVYDGNVRISLIVQRRVRELDTIPLDIAVKYQACTDGECFMPQERRLHLDVPVNALTSTASTTGTGGRTGILPSVKFAAWPSPGSDTLPNSVERLAQELVD